MAGSPYLKFRFNRFLRKTMRAQEKARQTFAAYLRQNIVLRWEQLRGIRRFVFGWWAFVLFLIVVSLVQAKGYKNYYLTDGPAAGGVFTEGVVGTISIINPVLQADSANGTVAALVYDGLLKRNLKGDLEGSLAQSWSLSKDGLSYTVKLRQDVFWHDGHQFDSSDVAFTIDRIQHPDTRSPYNNSWQGVSVTTPDDFTVVFKLPNVFVPFPQSLTIGIIPEHIFKDVRPENTRASEFNQAPVGTGPFRFSKLETRENFQRVELLRNDNYHLGVAKLDKFVIRSFIDHEMMKNAYDLGELSGIVGLRTFDDDTKFGRPAVIYPMLLHSQVFVFYKNSQPLLKNKELRQALTQSVDQDDILNQLQNKFSPAVAPILVNQIGYDPKFAQLSFDVAAAEKTLDKLGYVKGADGYRVDQAGKQLSLSLVSQNSDEYPVVARILQEQWAKVGVKIEVLLVDFEEFQQSYLRPHSYDILLYGINIGADPDVFAYWHSSQVGVNGFNLSEWKSDVTDQSLEAGRTRQDKKLRAAKYQTFLKDWRSGAPATALYRPSFVYVTHPRFHGLLPETVVDPTDRYTQINTWTIETVPTLKVEVQKVLD